MDSKQIEQLLEKYWNCETSLEEERVLRTEKKEEPDPEVVADQLLSPCEIKAQTENKES